MGPATHQDQPGTTLPPSYRYKPCLLLILSCSKPVSVCWAAAANFQVAATHAEQLVNILQQSPWALLPASGKLQQDNDSLLLHPAQLLQVIWKLLLNLLKPHLAARQL